MLQKQTIRIYKEKKYSRHKWMEYLFITTKYNLSHMKMVQSDTLVQDCIISSPKEKYSYTVSKAAKLNVNTY